MKIVHTNIEVAPKIGTDIRIIPIIKSLDDETCAIEYEILGHDGEILKSDRFDLTIEEYQNWGYSNEYLVDLTLNRLGLQRAIY